MKIPQPHTVPDIVKQFYSVISRPVRYASLFYTYYYLVEVENIRELRRDFEKIRDELYVAFYNYGVYSVVGEMMHLFDKFSVFDSESGDAWTYLEWLERGKDLKWVEGKLYINLINLGIPSRTVNAMVKVYGYNLKDWIKRFKELGAIPWHKEITLPLYYGDVEDTCLQFEKDFHCFSKPESYLEISKRFFGLPNWEETIAGEPWVKICKTLLRRNKTTPTIFVDACWNMQHDTGVWLRRVDISEEEFTIADKNPYELLTRIFEWNQDGSMVNILPISMKYEPSLYKYKRYIK